MDSLSEFRANKRKYFCSKTGQEIVFHNIMFSDFWTFGKFRFILEKHFFSFGLENVGAATYLTLENL